MKKVWVSVKYAWDWLMRLTVIVIGLMGADRLGETIFGKGAGIIGFIFVCYLVYYFTSVTKWNKKG